MSAEPRAIAPRPPAQVQAYVDVLGVEGAVEFLLTFGGAELYVAANPKGRGKVERQFGAEKAAALAAMVDRLPRRVPTAKPWVAQVLRTQGLSVAEIARRLHATDVSVRGWLRKAELGEAPDSRQLRLF
jgi:hypothetical protein